MLLLHGRIFLKEFIILAFCGCVCFSICVCVCVLQCIMWGISSVNTTRYGVRPQCGDTSVLLRSYFLKICWFFFLRLPQTKYLVKKSHTNDDNFDHPNVPGCLCTVKIYTKFGIIDEWY